MKRTITFTLFFALMLTLFTACGIQADTVPVPDSAVSDLPQETPAAQEEQEADNAALSALRLDASKAGCPCAMACLNFETDETAPSSVLESLSSKYPFLTGSVCVDMGGEEIYLIVPTDPQASIALYRCDVDDTGEMIVDAEPINSFSDGTTVLLHCNVSDIIPNALVHLDSGSDVFEFTPFLSLRDGRIGTEGVYDFTAYPADMPIE